MCQVENIVSSVCVCVCAPVRVCVCELYAVTDGSILFLFWISGTDVTQSWYGANCFMARRGEREWTYFCFAAIDADATRHHQLESVILQSECSRVRPQKQVLDRRNKS